MVPHRDEGLFSCSPKAAAEKATAGRWDLARASLCLDILMRAQPCCWEHDPSPCCKPHSCPGPVRHLLFWPNQDPAARSGMWV